MKILSLLLFSLLSLTAQAQGSFNYNKWKAEQDAKNNPEKVKPADEGPLFKSSYFFFQPTVQVAPFRGPALEVGGSFHGVHLEADAVYGTNESYQIKRHIGDSYHAYTYRPYAIALRAGYEFIYKGCFSLTPEVGLRQLYFRGERANEVAAKASETGTAQALIAGLRMSYAFTRHLALTVTPEYGAVIGKSDLYNFLVEAEGGDDIRRWAENVNVRIGLSIMF